MVVASMDFFRIKYSDNFKHLADFESILINRFIKKYNFKDFEKT